MKPSPFDSLSWRKEKEAREEEKAGNGDEEFFAASVVFFASRRHHRQLLSSDLEIVLPNTLNRFQSFPKASNRFFFPLSSTESDLALEPPRIVSTYTWRDAPSMNVARAGASSCVYDGKIYVVGGRIGLEDDESWAEVFDTKTQTWEQLTNPVYAYDTKQDKWEYCGNKSASFLR
ncbi:hypothetical protein AALP_AA4G092100 [Arabis alpina]|uniref:FKB95-like N-terminal Kelch domain-containing protein n=1 Tax=Arabis alpina TaxID=50452 RepID=A0A087H259_ARAAL|nr:hypothetical protein AALP_AA4G092100 [Arabis alpina]